MTSSHENSAQDYKATLNLPETSFPMKASLPEKEPQRLEKWSKTDWVETIEKARQGQESYSLLDGPPYANGEIHIGHALNKILKDIVVKSNVLNGKKATFLPTWDCHGLPIELNIEKKYGKVGQKLNAHEFRSQCRAYAQSQVSIQKEAFKRLGILADWDHPSLTMDFSYEANIIRLLGKVIEKGHLSRGYKPVYWCLDCGSSLAEAEVEYREKESLAIEVKFKAVDSLKLFPKFGMKPIEGASISAVIWTTTPWTLPANQALCLSAEIAYGLLKVGKDYLLVAKNLAPALSEKLKVPFDFHGEIKGEGLEGEKFLHPFQSREVPIVLGDHVTEEEGTGVVHTAPAHGVEDFAVGQKYGLDLHNPVGAQGCYTEETPDLAGLFVRKAQEPIIALLEKNGALLHQVSIRHSYPHCWRHKTPLIFRATSQWFISMEKNGLRQKALEAIETVNWIPSTGKSRILNMVKDRPDWCISRQRTWGVPMPLFLNEKTDELHPNTLGILESVAKAVEKGGIEAWFDSPEQFCQDEGYFPVPDTLDVWFDSGASSFCLLKHDSRLSFPADLYLEGSDQHRGWFQSSLLLSVAANGVPPYREVLTHGFTVDEKGYKMSKSLGNVISPQEIIREFGADILRLWVASSDYRLDMVVSKNVFKQLADMYRRLRNTARFLLANLKGFDPNLHAVEPQDFLALDQWVCDRASQLQKDIQADYAAHQFHQLVQKIHYFCSVELGGFYLDVIKDRQYTCQSDSLARRSAQTAMYHLSQALIRWLWPILSFTSDEISEYLPGEKSPLQTTTWWEFPVIADRKVSDQAVNRLIELREKVNREIEALRNEGKLGSSLEANVRLTLPAEWESALYQFIHVGELRFALIVSKVEVLSGESFHIEILPSTDPKCDRCWHRLPSVGESEVHPNLCARCVVNVSEGSGEIRETV